MSKSVPIMKAVGDPQVEPIVQTFTFACKSDSPPGPCWGPPDASGNPATPPPGG